MNAPVKIHKQKIPTEFNTPDEKRPTNKINNQEFTQINIFVLGSVLWYKTNHKIMLVVETKLYGNQPQYQKLDEMIRTASFVRNCCLRYWMHNDKVGQYDLPVTL